MQTTTEQKVVAGEIHLVVAERQDQVTGVFWTRNPEQHLANLSSATHVGRVDVRPGRHAPMVVQALSRRFSDSIQTRGKDCFWTSADFEEVLAAIREYDLDTGLLIERAGIRAKDRVYIPNVGRGVVQSFTRCGRLIVRLDRPDNMAAAVAIATRASVKPVLRAVR